VCLLSFEVERDLTHPCQGFTDAEIKHGPLALVRGFLPVIAVEKHTQRWRSFDEGFHGPGHRGADDCFDDGKAAMNVVH
jgi:hypothetical protein